MTVAQEVSIERRCQSRMIQSRWRAFACDLGYTEPVNLQKHVRYGLIALAVAAVILALVSRADGQMGLFWAFGLAFGAVLQRSRFCFASAFRDIFLLRHARNMKGVLLGLGVATLGFAVLMSTQAPKPALGLLPPDARAAARLAHRPRRRPLRPGDGAGRRLRLRQRIPDG
jgi:hypothetical protein